MQAILFDLDGVFYVGEQLVAGALDALAWCRQKQIPYLFVTNTTSRPTHSIVQKLSGFGIETEPAKIMSPPVATINWLKQQGIQRVSLYMGEQTQSMFSQFQLVTAENEPTEAVIIGDMGDAWTYPNLNRAFRQLMQSPPPRLIALGMTRYWRAPDGLRLDAGAIVSALQYASGLAPVVLGKPAREFFLAAVQQLGVRPDQVLMVGDDLRSDIGGAQQAGMQGVLVRTGKFREQDLNTEIRPDAVIDSVAALPQWWSENRLYCR